MTYKKFSVTHQNNVSISELANFYLNQIRKNKLKTLHFHPLKKSMQATGNQFRLAVLEHLTRSNAYAMANQAEALRVATQSAIEAGYIIHEVPAADYDRKIYLNDVKHEASQNNLELMAA